MGSSLTDIFPRPRPLPLGGRVYLAGELTLAQIADLQADADARRPDPLEGLRGRLDGMEAEPRRLALVAAHAAAEAGPPAWGWPADDAGHAHFVLVALGPHNPGFTPADAAAVVERVEPEEYAALWRVARGITPLDEVEALLGVDRSGGSGAAITWAQAVCELMEAYPGLSLAAIAGLTLGQVRALRSGGRDEVRGVPAVPTSGRSLKQMVAEARAKFHGTDAKGADHAG